MLDTRGPQWYNMIKCVSGELRVMPAREDPDTVIIRILGGTYGEILHVLRKTAE